MTVLALLIVNGLLCCPSKHGWSELYRFYTDHVWYHYWVNLLHDNVIVLLPSSNHDITEHVNPAELMLHSAVLIAMFASHVRLPLLYSHYLKLLCTILLSALFWLHFLSDHLLFADWVYTLTKLWKKNLILKCERCWLSWHFPFLWLNALVTKLNLAPNLSHWQLTDSCYLTKS